MINKLIASDVNLFSWIEFHPERLLKANVIIGLIIIIFGILINIFSSKIVDVISNKKPEMKNENLKLLVKGVGLIVIIVGSIIAVF